jgi:NAD(P)-dependent dehydrogenase (short-subunit alcohol dehydrogenase family)
VAVAVVTGAARGLGRSIAAALAGRGYEVLLTDVAAEVADAAARAIGKGAWAMAQDVRDPASHRAVAAAAAARGPVAVWVNNAGVLSVGAAWESTEAEVRRMVEVNVLGVIWGSQAAVAAMPQGRGT